MHKIAFFEKKKMKKICVPTLAKIFRPVTRNTLIFLFGLNIFCLLSSSGTTVYSKSLYTLTVY